MNLKKIYGYDDLSNFCFASGGGIFANGAITGAFSRMFNDDAAGHGEEETDLGTPQDLAVAINDEQNRLKTLLNNHEFGEEFSRLYGYKELGSSPMTVDLNNTGQVSVLLRQLNAIKIDALRNGLDPNYVSEAGATASAISNAAPKTGFFGSLLGLVDLFSWSGGGTYTFDYKCGGTACNLEGIPMCQDSCRLY